MTILLLSDYVAGTPHRIRDSGLDLSRLAVGDEMRLVPDPTNPYDPNAIKVEHVNSGQDCGFVPAVATPVIHAAIERGDELSVRISALPMQRFKEIVIQVQATLPQ